MVTKNKPKTQTTASRSSDSFPKAYMRLRTVLDALEINALRYCLQDASAAKRKQRAKAVEALLMPVIEAINGKPIGPDGSGGSCGDGYNNCGGVCVPYQCPENS